MVAGFRGGARARPGSQEPRVVVVGAGLAGLTAAYRLQARTGWPIALHEARTRVGGRVLTVRGLPGGLTCEAGGTFISSGDAAIRQLAREVGVPLVDLDAAWPGGGYAYHFDGRGRTRVDTFHGLTGAEHAATRELTGLPWPIRHGEHHQHALALDRMTVAEWISRTITPRAPVLAAYLRVLFESDYTAPVGEASALMAVAELARPGRSYDERYAVAGGTDTLTTAVAASLPAGTVHLGSALVALRRRSHGYRLTFEADGRHTDVDADAVVVALPFPVLGAIDLSRSGFSPIKRRAIRALGTGVAMKTNLAFHGAPWAPASSGESVSDLVPGWTWPGHPGQERRAGSDTTLLVCLTGASVMPKVPGVPVHGLAPRQLTDIYLRDLERIFPGVRQRHAGITRVDQWGADPWTRGTYSYYRVGTMTEIAGAEGRREGSAFFAGEHTARYANRSTMNGAVWSGERAARAVERFLRGR